MAIIVSCVKCGRQIRAPESLAGKRTRCPRCKAALRIPPLEEEREEEDGDDFLGVGDLLGGEDEAAGPQPPPAPPERHAMPRSKDATPTRRSPGRSPAREARRGGRSDRRARAAPRRARIQVEGEITPEMVAALAETRPWVLFLSVLGFIAVGLQALGLVVLFATASVAGGGVGAAVVVLLVGGGSVAISALLAYFLLQYAESIRALLAQGKPAAMETALFAQRSFWKLAGILVLVGLVLYLLAIVMMIAGGLLLRSANVS